VCNTFSFSHAYEAKGYVHLDIAYVGKLFLFWKCSPGLRLTVVRGLILCFQGKRVDVEAGNFTQVATSNGAVANGTANGTSNGGKKLKKKKDCATLFRDRVLAFLIGCVDRQYPHSTHSTGLLIIWRSC
jgi:hypothetical protein